MYSIVIKLNCLQKIEIVVANATIYYGNFVKFIYFSTIGKAHNFSIQKVFELVHILCRTK